MQSIPCGRFLRASVALLLCLCVVVSAQDEPPERPRARQGWSLFRRPKKGAPAEQLAYADGLRASHPRAARKQYRALVHRWPDSAEAPAAQYAYAQLLQEAGKLHAAFDEYQYLVERYAGQFPDYENVLEQQFAMATHIMDARKAKFLFFPGFKAPDQAVPLLEKIIENGPQWKRAAEAQHLIARAYELNRDFELAIVAYSTGYNRYPDSPWAEACAFGAAYCLYLISEENPNSEENLEQAWAALTLFLNSYPNSEQAALGNEYRKTLQRRRARLAFEKGEFYDRIARKQRAALRSYENFIKDFPNSEWTELAEIRIDALRKSVDQNEPEEP